MDTHDRSPSPADFTRRRAHGPDAMEVQLAIEFLGEIASIADCIRGLAFDAGETQEERYSIAITHLAGRAGCSVARAAHGAGHAGQVQKLVAAHGKKPFLAWAGNRSLPGQETIPCLTFRGAPGDIERLSNSVERCSMPHSITHGVRPRSRVPTGNACALPARLIGSDGPRFDTESLVTQRTSMQSIEPPRTVRMLRLDDVMQLTGLGRSTIYAAVKGRTFPAPVRISLRAVAWRETDLAQWQSSRLQTLEAADASHG